MMMVVSQAHLQSRESLHVTGLVSSSQRSDRRSLESPKVGACGADLRQKSPCDTFSPPTQNACVAAAVAAREVGQLQWTLQGECSEDIDFNTS